MSIYIFRGFVWVCMGLYEYVGDLLILPVFQMLCYLHHFRGFCWKVACLLPNSSGEYLTVVW